MEEQIYSELKQFRYLLTKVVVSQDLSKKVQFSKEAVKKAAAEL